MTEAVQQDASEGSRPPTLAKPSDIEALHRRCGVYTRPEVVRRILDAVGWTPSADLSQARLLEPAAGDGAFVVEAAERLIASAARFKWPLTARGLGRSITAYELHPGEALKARARLLTILLRAGMSRRSAEACARYWVFPADFLLSELPTDFFTHVVGNPPYVRWSKVPAALRSEYSRRLPRATTTGDLFLPFLDLALSYLRPGGQCGLLCPDRWRYMGFAEAFRKKWIPRLSAISESKIVATEAFVSAVDSYPTILVATKRESDRPVRRSPGRRRPGETLAELGCTVRVGPALGHTPAYVLEPDDNDVEKHLLRPWLDTADVGEGRVVWTGRRVIAMHDQEGRLVELAHFPLLRERLERFRARLESRAVVRSGAPWFRPIDRVRASDWMRPKLLIPELARVPRVAMDLSGSIPSHGLYVVFAPDGVFHEVYERLANGKLDAALRGVAPQVKSGYVRCYKRFLLKIRI